MYTKIFTAYCVLVTGILIIFFSAITITTLKANKAEKQADLDFKNSVKELLNTKENPDVCSECFQGSSNPNCKNEQIPNTPYSYASNQSKYTW